MKIRVLYVVTDDEANAVAAVHGDGPPTEYMLASWATNVIRDALAETVRAADGKANPVRDRLTADLRDIDADERFHYPCATTTENAPLAMIQVVLETQASYAQSLLRLIGYDGPEMQIRKGPRS